MILSRKVVMLCILFSADAFCGYNNIMWMPVDATTGTTVSVTGSSTTPSTRAINITFASGSMQMVAKSSECDSLSGKGTNEYTRWLKYPLTGETTDGLKWALSFDPSSYSSDYPGPTLGASENYNLLTFGKGVGVFNNNVCFNTGKVLSWSLPSASSVTGTLTFDIKDLNPGVYNFELPLGWAFEENKKNNGSDGGNVRSTVGSIISDASMVRHPVRFTLYAKCDFETKEINLSHGSITLNGKDSVFESAGYPFKISCEYGKTQVQVSLVGNTPVKGKTENYTPCGAGGDCELTFDTVTEKNEFNKTIDVKKEEIITIKSTYHPNSTAVAGKFTGSAILKINVL